MDSSGFQSGVADINRKLAVMRSEFKHASTSLGGFKDDTEQLRLKSEYLGKQIDLNKDKVKAISEAYEKSKEATGEDSKATQDLAIKLNNAKTNLVKLEGQLHETNSAIDSQSNKLMQTSKRFEELGEKMKNAGQKMQDIGSSFTTKVTAPILAIGVASGKVAMDFEESINKVSTIADEGVVPIEKMSKGILQLSDDMGIAADEISESVYQAISATSDTANSLGYVEIASKSAIGGYTDTATAIDGLTTVTNTYHLKGKKAMEDVANQMLMAQNFGKTTFGEMASSIGNVIPIAGSLNVSTKELFASIATLTKNGIQTSSAITGLKAAYSNILKPSKQASEMAEELGLEFNAAHLKTVGWAKFLDEVGEKTGGNAEQMATLFGSVEALNSVTVLAVNGQKDFADALDAMDNSAGALQTAFEKMDQGGKDSMEDTLNRIKNMGIEIGQKLMPTVEKIMEKVNQWIDTYNGLDEGTKDTILKIAGLAAAIGPLLMVGGKVVSLFGTISTGVSAVAGLFGGASVATAGATAGVAGASGALAGLGATLGAVLLPLAPFIAGAAAIGFVGYQINKHMSQDAIPAIEYFDDTISEATKNAVGNYIELDDKVTKSLMSIRYSNQVVTDEILTDISSKFQTMADSIKNGMEEHFATSLETMQGFFETSSAMTDEEESKIIEDMKLKNESKQNLIDSYVKRINEIMTEAKNQNRSITESEQKEINGLQELMKVNAVKSLSDTELESKAILERMKQQADELTSLQAADVVKNSLEQKDLAVAAAEEQYDLTIKEIIKQRDEMGSITAEQADKLIKDAERQKNEAIKSAQDMHTSVIDEAKKQAGEHAREIDWTTGQIKSKWDMLGQDLDDYFTELGKDIENGWAYISEAVPRKIEEMKTKALDKVDSFKLSINQRIDEIKQRFSSMFDFKIPELKLPHFELDGKFSLNPPSVPSFDVNWYDTGGIFDRPSIIGVGEKRPEFVGALDDLRYLIRDELNKSGSSQGGKIEITQTFHIDAVRDRDDVDYMAKEFFRQEERALREAGVKGEILYSRY